MFLKIESVTFIMTKWSINILVNAKKKPFLELGQSKK